MSDVMTPCLTNLLNKFQHPLVPMSITISVLRLDLSERVSDP